ncbi:MAG: phosphoglucosamine mutase [Candidatus Protistobacter heckmanni]|nr:phosphoglucosamine mutase [Candidatus Protistobacter heckmanni]
MSRKHFGTDGIRGRVGQPPITPDFVLKLGYAAGKVLATDTTHGHPRVLIGKDTRLSGYMLEAALQAGFAAAGVDVMLCGPMPTPGVAYLTRALRLSAGVVISASHNPYQDNGIKFFSAQGDKLPDETELQIEAELDKPMACVEPQNLGRARRVPDAAGRYIEFCKSTFPAELDLHGLKLVVDCAHGAAYHIAPPVFHELGADVISIGNAPDGMNINEGVGATAPATLAAAVQGEADLGLALDGDADRLIVVDAAGRLYNGDELLYAMVLDRLAAGQSVPGVVGTLMTNKAVEIALAKLGISLVRAKVGDRYVLEELKKRGWLLGGEGSGHLLALDRHSTGDGIISALQILSALKRSGKSLGSLLEGLTLYPQSLINVKVAPGYNWQSDSGLKTEIDSVSAELGDQGRVLIRPSGTEPVLRVMVEAAEAQQAKAAASRLAGKIAN